MPSDDQDLPNKVVQLFPNRDEEDAEPAAQEDLSWMDVFEASGRAADRPQDAPSRAETTGDAKPRPPRASPYKQHQKIEVIEPPTPSESPADSAKAVMETAAGLGLGLGLGLDPIAPPPPHMMEEPEKPKQKYRCRNCGHVSETRWQSLYTMRAQGCPGCGGLFDYARAQDAAGSFRGSLAKAAFSAGKVERMSTGVPEFDRVLGGGLIPGSTIIVTGPPGQGKTTLLLQTSNHIASPTARVLFSSGEMSAEDVGAFANRFGITGEHITLLGNQGDVYEVLQEANDIKAKMLVVDSAQTAYVSDVGGDEGSAEQVRATGNLITSFGKSKKCAALLVCHVTKEGDLAGPRALEHVVDAVVHFEPFNPLEFESRAVDRLTHEEIAALRVLRIGKNRFGAPGLRAILEMTEKGLMTPSKSISKLTI